ncbi:MAG: flagellar biosynthesis protein FlgC [Desulfuromonas sp.]|nr:MAG: flagellar biosynthesis protein FlgC [Desulfuromonas sp.]
MIMIDAMGSAVSGLQAQSLRLNSTANNVANSQTEGYTPSTVTMTEAEQGGVRAQLQKPVTANDSSQSVENPASKVDLAKEMVNMMQTKQFYSANLKTVSVADSMTGDLLDTFA